MPKKNKKPQLRKIGLSLARKRLPHFLGNRKAVSVVVSTVVLSAGVLALGIAVLYWAFSWGNIASLQYSRAVAANSHAVAERVGFEYITYSRSNNLITVNLINCGGAHDLNISAVYLWDNYRNYIGTGAYTPSNLTSITTGQPIPDNALDISQEGRFTVTLSQPLPDGFYNIRIVTGRGRNFDTAFIVP